MKLSQEECNINYRLNFFLNSTNNCIQNINNFRNISQKIPVIRNDIYSIPHLKMSI